MSETHHPMDTLSIGTDREAAAVVYEALCAAGNHWTSMPQLRRHASYRCTCFTSGYNSMWSQGFGGFPLCGACRRRFDINTLFVRYTEKLHFAIIVFLNFKLQPWIFTWKQISEAPNTPRSFFSSSVAGKFSVTKTTVLTFHFLP